MEATAGGMASLGVLCGNVVCKALPWLLSVTFKLVRTGTLLASFLNMFLPVVMRLYCLEAVRDRLQIQNCFGVVALV